MIKTKNIFLLVLGILIGVIGSRVLTNNQNRITSDENLPEANTSVETTPTTSEYKDSITSLIDKFEEFNKKQDSANIMLLFTPPDSPEESDAYIYLYGLDLPNPMFRPYTTANWHYKLDSYNIVSVNESDDISTVEVEENRQKWNNAPPEWVSIPTKTLVFEVKQVDLNYLIENYYFKGEEKGKYSGFYTTN